MAHRGMKKLRQFEKYGLVALCVLMLMTLGIGTGASMKGCGPTDSQGSFVLEGDRIDIEPAEFIDYRSYPFFQNRIAGFAWAGLTTPPPWKFVSPTQMFDPNFTSYDTDTRDLWTFIVLDKAAERAGVEISPDSVKHWIRNHRLFQDRQGNFNREAYDRFLGEVGSTWRTAGEFEKLVGRYLRVKYFLSNYETLVKPTREEVYNTWRNRSQRHDFDYVVQSVAPIRAEIDPASFTREEIEKYYAIEKVRANFRIPTKWRIESAYLFPADLSDEEFEALTKKAAEEDVVAFSPDEARRYYYANEDRYPLEPIRERLRREWEESREKDKAETPGPGGAEDPAKEDDGAGDPPPKDDEDGDGEPAEEQPADEQPADEQPADEEPADEEPADEEPADEEPADEEPADEEPGSVLPEVWEDPLEEMEAPEIYDTYFRARVERELFAQRLLTRLLKNERLNDEGVKAVAEKWGLSVWANEEPMDMIEFLDSDPVGGQELRETLVTITPDRVGDYTEEIVGLIGPDEGERGWCFFKVIDVIPEHYPELNQELDPEIVRNVVWNASQGLRGNWSEVQDRPPSELVPAGFPDADVPAKEAYTTEEILRLLYRQARAEDRAVERLTEIRELVISAGQSFPAVAAEKGYEIRTIRGASTDTVVPQPIEAGEGEELTEAEKARNREIRRRRFLLKGGMPAKRRNLDRIADTGAETFLDEVLNDKVTDAAYLVYVVAHRIPGQEEMPAVDAQRIAEELERSRTRPSLRQFFSFEEIVKRYELAVPGLTDRTDEPEE